MAAHASLSVLTFFSLFGVEVGGLNSWLRSCATSRLPSKRRAAGPVEGGPAGPSEASREAAPLTGDGGAKLRRFAGVLSVAAARGVALDGLRTRRRATRRVQIVRVGMLRGSGGGETGHLLSGLGLLGVGGLGEDQRDRLDRQVAALDEPLIVLF